MNIIKIIESESVDIHLSVISVLLIAILILCVIVYWKSFSNRKKQLTICYTIMCISALSFSFFTANSLISIMASLYASCVFAILYSGLVEMENIKSQNAIQNSIKKMENDTKTNQKNFRDEILQEIEKMKKDTEANQKTFRKEILQEIDKINKGFLYKHDEIFMPNKESEPNEDLFKKLTEGIKNSGTYIYEGEDAIKSSVCLYCIKDSLSQRLTKKLKATFIFDVCNEKEITQNYVLKFFTSLFLLRELYKKGCFAELIVVQRKNQTEQFINLMDDRLFYSPYPKLKDNRYPITFLYTPKENAKSFIDIFRDVISNILKDTKCEKIHITDTSDNLSKFNFQNYAKKGYFGETIKCFSRQQMKFSNSIISEYFESLINKRIEEYKNLIEKYK